MENGEWRMGRDETKMGKRLGREAVNGLRYKGTNE
jgi:hypothetical protein